MHAHAPDVTTSAGRGQHLGEDGGVQQHPSNLQNDMQNAFTGIACENNIIPTHQALRCEMHLQQFLRIVPLLFLLVPNQLGTCFAEARHHCGGNGKNCSRL